MVSGPRWCVVAILALAGGAHTLAQQPDTDASNVTTRLGAVKATLDVVEQRADGATIYKHTAQALNGRAVAREVIEARRDMRLVVLPTFVVELAPGVDARALAVETGHAVEEVRTYAGRRFAIMRAPTGALASAACDALATDKRVLSAETMLEGLYRPTGTVPTDTRLPDQWHHNNTGQSGGTPGEDANTFAAWDMGYSGVGSTILIVDNGVQTNHPDIAPNFNAAGSWDIDQNSADPNPKRSGDFHGTACAGKAAAADDGTNCVGAAFNAEIAGFRVDFPTSSLTDFVTAHTFAQSINEITSNSYGPRDSLLINSPLSSIERAGLEDGIANGRGGLGTIYVKSGGNGRVFGDDSNFDGFAGSRYTISVTASSHDGVQSSYAEWGTNHLVNAPSSSDGEAGTTTSDVENIPVVGNGYSGGDFTTTGFGGTSSACPLVAGVVAMMLEANPSLGWRDVQQVLARTASRNDPSNPDWSLNDSGLWYNPRYGFGRVDAAAAVALAETWTNVGPEITEFYDFNIGSPIPLADGPNGITEVTVNVSNSDIGALEFVEFRVDFDHSFQGDMRFVLISPDGVQSVVHERQGDDLDGYSVPFTTVRHLGDDPNGTWTLRCVDTFPGDTGQLRLVSMRLFGVAEQEPVIDCDNNTIDDALQIAADPSLDCDSDGALDTCQIIADASLDLDANAELDACQIAADPSLDCDADGELDSVTIARSLYFDCDNDGTLDACQIDADPSLDANGNGFFDACEPGLISDADASITPADFTTINAGNDFGLYCGGTNAGGPDYIVEIRLTVENSVTLFFESTLGGTARIALLDEPVFTADCLGVNDNGETIKVLHVPSLQPGFYYVVVDSDFGAGGDFDLDIEFSSPGVPDCVADFDGSGAVNLGDFGIFGASFGSTPADSFWNPNADFDMDGDVDLGDFGVFGSEFGRTDCP